MKVKVKEVKANPYRNIDHYPLNKDKIMALTTSIEKTGFWDNLVGREVDGEIQIAYGHHRIEALRLAKGYGYDFEFELPIKDLADGTMIQIMANENMQEWGHSIVVTDETVKVAKEYLEIRLPENESKYNNKGMVSSNDIANFLGWNQSKVAASLKRMRYIDEKIVDKKAVESLPSETHAEEFVKAISKTDLTPKEQRKIANEITDKGMGKRDVKGTIEVKAFEKKYPRGKKESEKKTDPRVIKFENHLLAVSNSIEPLTNDIKKLKQLHNEIKNISGGTAYRKARILFISIAELQRSINEFLEVMSKEEELTEDSINILKQITQ